MLRQSLRSLVPPSSYSDMSLPPSIGKSAGKYQRQQQYSPSQSRPDSSQSQGRGETTRRPHRVERYDTAIQRFIAQEAVYQTSLPTALQSSGCLHHENRIDTQNYHVAQQRSPNVVEETPKSTTIDVQAELYAHAAAAASGIKFQAANHVMGTSAPNPQHTSYFPQNQTSYRSSTIPYHYQTYPANSAMSLSYESRGFMPDTSNYPQMEQVEDLREHRYPSPPRIDPQMADNPYQSSNMGSAIDVQGSMVLSELQHKEDSDAASPGRSKPIPKPLREETKDSKTGKYLCEWPGCTEETKEFVRKCEWNKHMDKHDRPYRCLERGCEKLPGFTYSGGLLRHEREVHNKHGGPRKQLNCPHPNCKRNTGKGFSRQENLNEHLRRVHTDTGFISAPTPMPEDDGGAKIGKKRKRDNDFVAPPDFREEMKRLKAENEELRRQAEQQHAQTAEMMRQLQNLQHSLSVNMQPRLQAPQAPMM